MRQLKTFMRNRKKEMLACGPCECRTLQCWRYANENCGCGDTPEPTPGETLYFISYGDEDGINEYARGSVKTTDETRSKKTKVIVTSNSVEGWVGQEFYIDSKAEADDGKIYQLYQLNGSRLRGIDVRVEVFAEEQVETLSLDELNS